MNRAALSAAILLLAGFAFGGGTASAAAVTPESVQAMIAAKGARGAIDALMHAGTWYAAVIPGIATGGRDWLRVARALRPGVDGETGEDLDDALAAALLAQPYEALPVLKEQWWNDSAELCVFGSDTTLPGGIAAYLKRLKAALAPPAPAGQESLRQACLDGVQSSMDGAQRNQGGGK